jgi:hypothetical protein
VRVYEFSIYRWRDPRDPGEFVRITEVAGIHRADAEAKLRLQPDERAVWFGRWRPADGPLDSPPVT